MPPTLETERLRLRPFRLDDAEAMFAGWTGDDEVTKYLTWPTHKSVEDTKALLARWVAEYERSTWSAMRTAVRSSATTSRGPTGDAAS